MIDTTSSLSDDQVAGLDISALLRAALPHSADTARRELFGVGAVGAAVVLDRLGTYPRSVTFLAEIVRAGGARSAAELSEPLPGPARTAAIRPWLSAAAGTEDSIDSDDLLARWLRAVAAVIALRSAGRGRESGGWRGSGWPR